MVSCICMLIVESAAGDSFVLLSPISEDFNPIIGGTIRLRNGLKKKQWF